MTRLAILLSLAWLGLGGYGAFLYGHNYYVFRGFSPPVDPRGVAPGRLVATRFFSGAMGRRRSYDIYLPPGYARAAAAGKRFPVLYLLHGSPGWPRLFLNAGALGVSLDVLEARRRVAPFIVVMPDGRDGSLRSDTEWADTRHGRYESFVLNVVRDVDRRWATRPDRRFRAIAGNSEGAFGAVNIGLRHLSTFSVIESWSGYFSQQRTGPFKRASGAKVQANSPAAYVGSLKGQLRAFPLHAFLYGGTSDKDLEQTRAFAPRLRAAGAKVSVGIYPGGHDWRLWRERTPAMLRYAARWFGR